MECKRGMRKYGASGLSGAAARTGEASKKRRNKYKKNEKRGMTITNKSSIEYYNERACKVGR